MLLRPVQIKSSILEDAKILADFSRDVFIETFGDLYTFENLTSFLEEYHSHTYYKLALADTTQCIWIAWENQNPVGYMIAGPGTIDLSKIKPSPACKKPGEIKRLYVAKSQQGKGVAHQLMAKAMTWLEAECFDQLFLSVYSDNIRAQKFYQNYGFRKVGKHIFPVGSHEDIDYIYTR